MVILDFDGTLADTADVIIRTTQATISPAHQKTSGSHPALLPLLPWRKVF